MTHNRIKNNETVVQIQGMGRSLNTLVKKTNKVYLNMYRGSAIYRNHVCFSWGCCKKNTIDPAA